MWIFEDIIRYFSIDPRLRLLPRQIKLMMLSLPPELLLEIIPYIPQQTILALSATNKYLRSLALPYLYETIHFSAPDMRIDFGDYQRDHFRRLNQLLRSLVNNRILARYIHRIELVRWEIDTWWAGIGEHPLGCVKFTQSEMDQLRHVLASVAFSVGCPDGTDEGDPAGIDSNGDPIPVLATRGFASTQTEDAADWWMEELRQGKLDASSAVLLFIVSKEQAGMHNGLRELRLKLDHDYERSQPESLWWVLGHLLGNALHSDSRRWNVQDSSIDTIADDRSVGSDAFPYLQKVEIIATKRAKMDLEDYDCNISEIAIPFLFHRCLSDLRLTLLDESSFSWSDHEASMPRNQLFIKQHRDRVPSHLSGPPMTQLRTLHLKIAHVESLHEILLCTPYLTTLSFTQIQNFEILEHKWTDISTLASALALVKEPLITLTLRIFIAGDAGMGGRKLGQDCGPRGNPRMLRLWEFPNLRNLTIGLTLLLGVRGRRSKSLAEALPLNLEVLALVFDLGEVEGGDWEDDEIVSTVRSYVKERGKGMGGKLKKVVFLYELANDFYLQWEAEEWQDWPPEKSIIQLEIAAMMAGVLIESAASHEHMRWYHDYNVARQRQLIFYELPRHSTDPVPTDQIEAFTVSHVQVWGDYDQQGLPIVTDRWPPLDRVEPGTLPEIELDI